MSAPVGSLPIGSSTHLASPVSDIVAAVLNRVAEEGSGGPAADVEWLTVEVHARLRLARTGLGLTDAELDRFAAHYRVPARSGAPLRSTQLLCRAVVADTLTELWARAEPEDVTDLLRLSRWIARHHRELERLLVQVHCELLDVAGVDVGRGRAERLLAGLGTGADAVDQAHLVVVLGAGGTALTGPRSDTLGTVVDGFRHLLVPVPAQVPRRTVWRQLSTWVAGHSTLHAVGEFTERAEDIPVAAAAARELLAAATAVGLPTGLVGRRELVLETVLAAQPSGRETLAALLDPLAADVRLLDTLAVFFAHDLDRSRTAAALFLSRGGLSLRLDRITQLTGLDPRSTRGIQVLGSALSARALAPAPAPGAA